MPINIYTFCFLILILFLCLNLFSLFGGLDFTDTFWHINVANYYFDKQSFIKSDIDQFILQWQKDNNFLYNFEKRISFHYLSSLLTFYFFSISDTILVSRILPFFSFSLIIYIISIKNYGFNDLFIKLFLFTAIVGYLPCAISFDYFTVLLVALFGLFISKFEEKKENVYLFLIFIILNLSFFVRFQNFFMIFVSFIFLHRQKINFRILILMHLLPILLLTTLIFGVDFFSVTYKLENTEHSLSNIFNNYLKDLPLFIISSLFTIPIIFLLLKSNYFIKFGCAIFIIFSLIYFFGSDYNWDYRIILSSFLISIIISNIIVNRKKVFQFITFLLTVFIFPIGSATGLFKLSYGFLLSGIVYENLNRGFQKVFILLFAITLPFTTFYKLSYGYEDVGVLYANSSYNDSKLFGIRSFEIRSNYVNQIQKTIIDLQSNNYHILIGGRTSHLFTFLNSTIPLTVEFYQQDLDPNLFHDLIQTFPDKKFAYFHFDNYPEFYSTNLCSFEESVEGLGFKYNIKDGFDYLTYEN